MMGKFVAFVRWLAATETLPAERACVDPRRAGSGSPGFSRWLLRGDTLQQAGSKEEYAPRPRGFLGSVLSHDALSSPESERTALRSHPARFWTCVLGGEELPVAEPADRDRDQSSRTMFFTRLLAAETCPEHPGGAIEHREVFLRRLLAPEQCPSEPAEAAPVKRGLAGWLLEQKACPVDSTSAPVRRRGFWRNLFASERL